jgi:thiosulfate dehydrogenase [quinone] large subunit
MKQAKGGVVMARENIRDPDQRTMRVQPAGLPNRATSDAVAGGVAASRLPLIGLLAVQVFMGYEWLISGLTKLVRGGFPAGLADELRDASEGAPGWYVSILNHVVIPHGKAFGYLTEIGELLVGVALIGGALVWLLAWRRMPASARVATLAVVALAALAGAFMTVNFHLADGAATPPWLLPDDVFTEGVDIDSLMTAIQVALAAVAGGLLWGMWRSRRGATNS